MIDQGYKYLMCGEMSMRKITAMLMSAVIFATSVPVCAYADKGETNSNEASGQLNLSNEQIRSIVMLNYLSALTGETNTSSSSRRYLEEVYSTLINNTKPNAVDSDTQDYLNELLQKLEEYRMFGEKRERLDYIYEQNKAAAIRNAIPYPIDILNIVQSESPSKIMLSALYMAIDVAASYQSGMAQAEQEYLYDSWELDDSEKTSINNTRQKLFNHMINISHEYSLPDELVLNELSVDELVKWEKNTNITGRLQFLETNQGTYKAFGDYWLIKAKSYYENGDYKKCLGAIASYEGLGIDIFKKDHGYAEILPLAIYSADKCLKGDEYVEKAVKFAAEIMKNTENSAWDLRYYAALTYSKLYSLTNKKSYLKTAYDIALNNVNSLVETQKNQNTAYLKDIVEAETPKNASKSKKEEIKQYNKSLEKKRKTELPPISEPLLLNCDLLFDLANTLNISSAEKNKIDKILHENGGALFLVQPIDRIYTFDEDSGKVNANADVAYSTSELSIPAELVTDDATIEVTIKDGKDTHIFKDWEISKVEREKNGGIETFYAIYKNKDAEKYEYTENSSVSVKIVPKNNCDCETLTEKFKVGSYKKIGVLKKITFEKEG